MSKKEWECWLTRPERSELQHFLDYARKNLLAIPDQFELIEDNAAVLPGIKLIIAPGHTPGNTILDITSGTKQLLCVGDILHSPIDISDPAYYTYGDMDPVQAINMRIRILSQGAKSGRLVFACHLPFPGLGCIEKKGDIFSWRSIERKP